MANDLAGRFGAQVGQEGAPLGDVWQHPALVPRGWLSPVSGTLDGLLMGSLFRYRAIATIAPQIAKFSVPSVLVCAGRRATGLLGGVLVG